MSQTKTVIEHIAYISLAAKNCLERSSQPLGGDAERWYRRHVGALCSLLDDSLPHGPGFDDGVKLNHEMSDAGADRFVFDCPFHCMNDAGFYTDRTEFRVTVTPSFVGTMNLEIERIGGPVDDAGDLADYVAEAMQEALTAEIEIPSHYYADV